MHELAIAQDFWKTILDNARTNHIKKITKISLMLGEASGIEKDFLEHSLRDHIMPGSIAADAQLEITLLPLAASCKSCATVITKDMMSTLACPQCGSRDIDIQSGRETYVASIEGE
ncbi:MAG: hydrogenase maturation nickel metallochaperone HypA [Elusimicrobia bacterium]|nr:hydrogenase maturation nickel metallochaperone HypA [Elusimicrobiota bacterium]